MAIDRRVQQGIIAGLAVAAIAVAATSCEGNSHPTPRTPLPAERLGEPPKPPRTSASELPREVRESETPTGPSGSALQREVQKALEGREK